MSSPAVGVFALQGDVREHLAVLASVGARAFGVRRVSELEQCDGLVIPGGESTTMSKLARTFDLFDPIRQRIKEGLPVFGTCAGMIMLAERVEDGTADQETLGGLDITVRRNAFGRQVDSFEEDLRIPELGEAPLHAVFIRAPIIERVGASVEVLATLADGTIVAAREGALLATSFHPELTGDARFHALLVKMARAVVGRRS